MAINNPSSLDIVASINIHNGPSAQTWSAANEAHYVRSIGNGVISKIGFTIGVQSGNLCVGVYSSSGAGRDRVPLTRLATSGSVACPAPGYVEIALDVPVLVTDTMFLAMSADNTTVSIQATTGGITNVWKGLYYYQSSAFVLPATAAVTNAGIFKTPQLVGVV